MHSQGRAYKAALMLQLCHADWEPRFVDCFNGETHTPDYWAINVVGEVPVLEHGDIRLSQSGVILDYLVEQLGHFGPADWAESRAILRWLVFDNHKLTSYTATLRFLLQSIDVKDGDVKDGPIIDCLRSRSKSALGVLDQQPADREFVIGDRPTIADLSLCGYLFPHPRLAGADQGAARLGQPLRAHARTPRAGALTRIIDAPFMGAWFVAYCAGPHCNGADKAALQLAGSRRPEKERVGGVALTGGAD